MARNLGRQFATIIERSSPKFALPNARSEFCPNSASRLIHSSTQLSRTQQQHHQDQRVKNGEAPIDRRVKDENEKEDDDDVDVDVNKETGEVGGPRGPEPTRYGDWERNGRCYDF